ncbi:MAG: zinc ribbon domain-containing protein [Sedimentisphaerales bacterium]|nr:zinc ribbon domain-containing protein [Sedimentisphaerales bacterium]
MSANNDVGLRPVCPACGSVMPNGTKICTQCGCNLVTDEDDRRRIDRSVAGYPLLESLRPLIKIAVVIAIVGGIGWGLYYGACLIFEDVQETNPWPTDPQTTTTDFFKAMQGGTEADYQACYMLLSQGRKAAVIIGGQSRREGYFPHFERIRQYLTTYCGANFADTMQVDPTGQEVWFANNVVLHISHDASTGLDKQTHYAVREIIEFPIDAAPGIGLEAYERQLDRALGDIDTVGTEEDSDDPAEIVRRQDYETDIERLRRVTRSCRNARQLDTKHALLLWILSAGPTDSATGRLLQEFAEDEFMSPHIRQLAQNSYDYYFQQ